VMGHRSFIKLTNQFSISFLYLQVPTDEIERVLEEGRAQEAQKQRDDAQKDGEENTEMISQHSLEYSAIQVEAKEVVEGEMDNEVDAGGGTHWLPIP
jgi:hypothetical protein